MFKNYIIDLPEPPHEIKHLQSIWTLSLINKKLKILSPEIGHLENLRKLELQGNPFTTLPPEIGQLQNLQHLDVSHNQLTSLPPEIGQLQNLQHLDVSHNQLTSLPPEISQLKNLKKLFIQGNPFHDLSALANHPNQNLTVSIPCRYWSHCSDWQAKWLLDESNAEIRRMLIQKIGYDRICQELRAIELDTWREYTLLKIDARLDVEPIHLLKMTCPSTAHIHTLRVPPNLTSARAAIRWANWDIDSEAFAAET